MFVRVLIPQISLEKNLELSVKNHIYKCWNTQHTEWVIYNRVIVLQCPGSVKCLDRIRIWTQAMVPQITCKDMSVKQNTFRVITRLHLVRSISSRLNLEHQHSHNIDTYASESINMLVQP